jgi:hypothetical protein
MAPRLSVFVLSAFAIACTPVPSLPAPAPTHPASPEASEAPEAPRSGVLALDPDSENHADHGRKHAESKPTDTPEKQTGNEGHQGHSGHERHDEHGGH